MASEMKAYRWPAPILLLAAAMLGATAQGVAAAGFANERRVVIDRLADNPDARQFNSIGQVLAVAQDGRSVAWVGTGFLISPCLVLTNYHVAYGARTEANQLSRLLFRFGQTGDRTRPFKYSEEARAIAAGRNSDFEFPGLIPIGDREDKQKPGAIEQGKSLKSEDRRIHSVLEHFDDIEGEDWALLRLKQNAPSTFVPIPVDPVPRDGLDGVNLVTAGFPGDLAEADNWSKLYGDLNCSALQTSSNPDEIFSNCMQNHGDSGSPIMRRLPDGRLVAVGIVAAGERFFDALRFLGLRKELFSMRYPHLMPTELERRIKDALGAVQPSDQPSVATLATVQNGDAKLSVEVGLFSSPELPEDYFASALDAHAGKEAIAKRASHVPVGQHLLQLIDANRCTP
jgi:Trypsin-like peptidase domain